MRATFPAGRLGLALAVWVIIGAALLAGCASAPAVRPPGPHVESTMPPTPTTSTPAAASSEVNPAGDIPDNQVFVPFTAPDGAFSVSVPEGWARITERGGVRFTDKLNSVAIASALAPQAPTVDSVRAEELPALRADVPGYQPGTVREVTRAAGHAVLITYDADSTPDAVTGKVRLDAVERYEFWRAGRQVTLTLSGPTGADNVDPWRTVTDSLRWQG